MTRGLVGLLCACLLATTTSCSILFVKPPPKHDPIDPGDCTESRVAPALDTAMTGLMALTLALFLRECTDTTGLEQDGTPADGCNTGQWIGLAWTGVVTAGTAYSAYAGFRDTGRCRDRRALEAPVAQVH